MERNDNHKALVLITVLSVQHCKILRKEILGYCMVENKTHRANVLMSFIMRIHANLYSAAILSRESIRKSDSVMLKLPIGLVLRNSFMDCLYAIYLSSLDDAQFEEEVTILNKDYAFSLPSRKDVWVDKVREMEFRDEDGFPDCYDDMVVDNFCQYLKEFTLEPMSNWNYKFLDNSDIRESQQNRRISIDRECQKLMNHEKFGAIIRSIYGYYKYFSQYEHFSESAHGDTLAPYYQDNVSFPCAIKSLTNATKMILEEVKCIIMD